MRRHCLNLGALGLGSVLCGAWLLLVTDHLLGGTSAPIRLYTVAQVRTLLRDAPDRWIGRTVLLQATAKPCPWWHDPAARQYCLGQQEVLFQADDRQSGAPLPLATAALSPLESALRGLPFLGAMLEHPQPIPLYRPALFRVELQAVASSACGGWWCYQAQLLAALR